MPYDGKMNGAFWIRVGFILIPPLTLIILVLGSIISGIATVNQAGAIGAAGAIVMAGYRLNPKQDFTAYLPALLLLISILIMAFALMNFDMNVLLIQNARDLSGILIGFVGSVMFIISLVWSCIRLYKIEGTLNDVMLETAKTTSLVFIILLGAAVLTAAFRAFGGEELVREFLNSLPGGFWAKFIIVMAVIFVLGFFLDFIEIAVVVVPIVAPILLADPSANITAVWLGVMIGLNIQTSFLTPPFGFALFYLRGVAPAIVKTVQMYKGVVPFILLQILALFIVGYYPALVNYLPNRTSFLSENSPPPKNPRLQLCIEEYSANILYNGDNSVQKAITKMKTLNLEVLPEKVSKSLIGAVADAEKAVLSLQNAIDQNEKIQTAALDYKPIQRLVRRIEGKINTLKKDIKDIKKDIVLQKTLKNSDKVKELEGEVLELESEIKLLETEIPRSWDSTYKVFNALMKEEEKLRNIYRRSGDKSYQTVEEILLIFSNSAAISKKNTEFDRLIKDLSNYEKDEKIELLKNFSKSLNSVAGLSSVKRSISKAIKELKRKNVKQDKVDKALVKAEDEINFLANWVGSARAELEMPLEEFRVAISTSLGLRSQENFSKELALSLAACNANHRDLSLYF